MTTGVCFCGGVDLWGRSAARKPLTMSGGVGRTCFLSTFISDVSEKGSYSISDEIDGCIYRKALSFVRSFRLGFCTTYFMFSVKVNGY